METVEYKKHWYQGRYRVLHFIGIILLGILGAAVLGFLLGYFVMLLWNWLMPAIFGLGTITFWQSVGIIILAKLLFFRPHPHSHDRPRSSRHEASFKHHFAKRASHRNPTGGFFRWKYYDEFWESQGEKAYEDFVKTKEPKEE